MCVIRIIIISFIITALSCRNDERILDNTETSTDTENIETPHWTEQTHSNTSTPNYAVVFHQNSVLRIDIKIEADDWEKMQDDLAANISSGRPGGGPGGPGGAPGGFSEFDPVWVPSSVIFNNVEWYKVGIRFKGNSSLSSTYGQENKKLPFKLDFDQFEDSYPAIKDQRFYGFKQLSLKNNFDDMAFIREKVASDLFLDFGLVSPQTSFYQLYIDFGEGAEYFGLYTLVEEVDDTVIDSHYSDAAGNLYKPDGTAARFSNGTYSEAEMEKKSNEELADYSDVLQLYTVLNSSIRTSKPDQWKADLEAILDVDVFLKWLAANTAMQNWDTYGVMTHNFYLYNNPENGKLNWIPWDNNEAFQDGKQGGALNVSLNEVGSGWPLISYIIAVPEYRNKYNEYLQSFISTVFTSEKMNSIYNNYYALLKDAAYAETNNYSFLRSPSDFDQAIETLKSHVVKRAQVVSNYLAIQ